MNEETKTCTGCNETKDVSCFSKNKKKYDGLQYKCKACEKAYGKAYREANKEKTVSRNKDYYEANKEKMIARVKIWQQANEDVRKTYDKAYRQTQRGRYRDYKGGAKKRGIPFDLTFDEFMSFWQQDCYYCGDQIATIGIDRVDSSVGYTLANCVSCCWECNRLKGDRPNEALNTHMLKMLKHQGII